MTIINNIEIDNIKYQENDIKRTIKQNDPIEDKFKNKTLKQKHILYNTFMDNMRNLKLYTNNIF